MMVEKMTNVKVSVNELYQILSKTTSPYHHIYVDSQWYVDVSRDLSTLTWDEGFDEQEAILCNLEVEDTDFYWDSSHFILFKHYDETKTLSLIYTKEETINLHELTR